MVGPALCTELGALCIVIIRRKIWSQALLARENALQIWDKLVTLERIYKILLG